MFARSAQIDAETLYVIGGLYGNPFALDAIDEVATTEDAPPQRVFNGDFHWFDADAPLFAQIQRHVLMHSALRGNVETEIASDDDSAGCGCAYPESVPDDDVERSNAILRRLREVAGDVPAAASQLAALPMFLTASIGELRVGIVHGDAWSLAGWRFAHDTLHNADDESLEPAFQLGAVDGFASSHTCAPALKVAGERFIINNGAAGMANFEGEPAGVITRMSLRALPNSLVDARLYGLHQNGVWIDALAVRFDCAKWLALFDRIWPPQSPAAISYRKRIEFGPAFSVDQALGRIAAACAIAG